MSVDFNLSFRYKGDRNYVHGTDIFQAVRNWLAGNGYTDIVNVELSFHKIIRSNLRCRLVEGTSVIENENFAALFRFQYKDSDFTILLWEDETPVTERYPYSEAEITDAAVVEPVEKKISLSQHLEYTPIEKIVALNKYLLTSLFSDQEGKWYFGKLELQKDFLNLPADSAFELKLERNMGVRYTKSSIKVEGESIGYIYFSMNE